MLRISEKILKNFPLPGDVLDVTIPGCPTFTRGVVSSVRIQCDDPDCPKFWIRLIGLDRYKIIEAELDIPGQKVTWSKGKRRGVPISIPDPQNVVSPLREYCEDHPRLRVVIPFEGDIITAPGITTYGGPSNNIPPIPITGKEIYHGYLMLEEKDIRKVYYRADEGMIPDAACYGAILESLYYDVSVPGRANFVFDGMISFIDLCGKPGFRDPSMFL
jgi:hypothetical protein